MTFAFRLVDKMHSLRRCTTFLYKGKKNVSEWTLISSRSKHGHMSSLLPPKNSFPFSCTYAKFPLNSSHSLLSSANRGSKRCYADSSSDIDISDRGTLVYTGRVGNMLKMLKIFSLTTSSIGLALQPYLITTYQDAPLVTAIPFFAVLNVFVFANPLLIHFIAKKYVLEMYFNPETKVFTGVMLSFFARKYSFNFTAEDVKVPDVPGLFAILNVKDKPLFVLDSDFSDLEVYKHMMGFDKPIDFGFMNEQKK